MQKKLLLIITSCLYSFISFSQVKKGTITGNFKFSDLQFARLRNSNNYTNTNLNATPGIGYFIKDNLEIGVGFNYNLFRYKFNGVTGIYSQRSNSFGINAYSNYYFGKGRFKPYLTFQTGWQYTDGSYTESGIKNNFSSNRFYIGSGIGLNYNISKKIALFTEATYQVNNPLKDNSSGHFNLGGGIRIFFNRKKKN